MYKCFKCPVCGAAIAQENHFCPEQLIVEKEVEDDEKPWLQGRKHVPPTPQIPVVPEKPTFFCRLLNLIKGK